MIYAIFSAGAVISGIGVSLGEACGAGEGNGEGVEMGLNEVSVASGLDVELM